MSERGPAWLLSRVVLGAALGLGFGTVLGHGPAWLVVLMLGLIMAGLAWMLFDLQRDMREAKAAMDDWQRIVDGLRHRE